MPRAASQSRSDGGNASPPSEALRQRRQGDAGLVGLLEQDAQEARRADIAVGRKSAIACNCSSVWPVPAGNTVQPSAMRAGLHHRAGGREVIAEAVVTRSPARKPAAKSARAMRQ